MTLITIVKWKHLYQNFRSISFILHESVMEMQLLRPCDGADGGETMSKSLAAVILVWGIPP